MTTTSIPSAIGAGGPMPEVTGARLPLSFVGAGNTAVVVKVRGDEELRRHLGNLGFVEGNQVHVVSEQAGNLIVEVLGTRLALDKTAAMKIVTR